MRGRCGQLARLAFDDLVDLLPNSGRLASSDRPRVQFGECDKNLFGRAESIHSAVCSHALRGLSPSLSEHIGGGLDVRGSVQHRAVSDQVWLHARECELPSRALGHFCVRGISKLQFSRFTCFYVHYAIFFGMCANDYNAQ